VGLLAREEVVRQFVSDRRFQLSVGAFVAGVALFAGGVLAANAMDSDDDPSGDTGDNIPMNVARDGIGSGPAGFNSGRPADDVDRAGAEDASLTRPYGGCQVPVGNVLADGKVDPTVAGFASSYLGGAFQLTSFTLRGEADCPDGVTPSGETRIVVDTGWKHVDTGLAVYVSQRQDAEPSAAVLEEQSARFWRDGYAFSVSVDSYSVQPLAGRDDGGPDIARDLAAQVDPRAAEVLRAALADLNAPSDACFYTVRLGSLDDLAGMGIGDPRGAIPSGYTLQDAQVRAWNAPTGECGTTASTEGLYSSFNATWVQGGEFGAIYVSASSVGEGEQAYPGSVGPNHAGWSNGEFHFNVSVKSDAADADEALLRAIASALDPGFANACVALEVELSDDDLAARGFGIPSAPDGYSIIRREHRGASLTGDCSAEARDGYGDSAGANWTLEGPDGAVISVSAYESGGPVPADEKRGYIGGNSIYWFAGDKQYNVTGYNERGGSAPSQETLIELARSIDPGFDPDSLEQAPDGGGSSPGSPGVMPLPAEDAKPR
jgi:hypothetical protein